MFKPFENDGFKKVPNVAIDRIAALDGINMQKGRKIVARRFTVGFHATPRQNHGSQPSPRHTPPVPQLIPLKSALKLPLRPPFNVRGRKSMFPNINVSPISIRSPIPRGTTTQIILNRVASVASTSGVATASTSSDVTLPSPVGDIQMGRLNYSASDDSE